jgi:virulence-associated protein VapD
MPFISKLNISEAIVQTHSIDKFVRKMKTFKLNQDCENTRLMK